MEEKDLKRIRDWEQFDAAWKQHGDAVKALDTPFGIEVAVELLFPTSKNEEVQEDFDQASFEISQARNANTEVKTEAFQNKLGFYDVLKAALPPELSVRVEWKPGLIDAEDGAPPISVRDVVALAWIPLNVANGAGLLPIDISVLPQNIYRNKGECSDKFNMLMQQDEVTEPIGGKAGQQRRLVHHGVESCLKLAGDIPRLMDLIYEHFPHAYNDGGFKIGKRNEVKMYNPEKVKELKAANKDITGYTATRPVTPFFRRTNAKMIHKYPEAFIIPFVTALSALMKVKGGRVVWAVDDIDATVLKKLAKAAPLFDGQLDAYNWDPQKLAKAPSSHAQVASYYRIL